MPRTVVVNSDEVRDALAEPINSIVEAVMGRAREDAPELSSRHQGQGIVLTGGGALRNLDVMLREETGSRDGRRRPDQRRGLGPGSARPPEPWT